MIPTVMLHIEGKRIIILVGQIFMAYDSGILLLCRCIFCTNMVRYGL